MSSTTQTQSEVSVRLSDAINRIAVSPTLAVLAEAEKYKARGVDVADFGPGEPDFPTPEHIKRAAIRALEENRTKYTPSAGIAALRQAICDWHAAQLGSSYQPSECASTVGGKHALFNIISCLLNAGEEVIIPAPYWVSYPDIVKYVGGTPVFLQTRESEGFCVHASEVEKLIGPKTRILIINSPSNPTGAVIPPDEFEKILRVCERRSVWLLSDECYSHFTYGSAKPYSIASVPGAKDRVIIAGSLSKTFAMTGWRLGYVLAPKPLIDAVVKLSSQSTSNPTSIVQYAGLEALRGSMDSVHEMLKEYDRRRARIVAGLRTIPGMTCTDPQGAFYVFPNVSNCKVQGAAVSRSASGEPDTSKIARELLDREHVALVAGEGFGAPGYLRLSYATSIDRIEEGIRRLTRFFA
jgi:aspartate aminotransferase